MPELDCGVAQEAQGAAVGLVLASTSFYAESGGQVSNTAPGACTLTSEAWDRQFLRHLPGTR